MQRVEISDINRRSKKRAWLSPAAAAAYEVAKRDGMPGGCVSDAGRTYAEQQDVYADYLAGKLKATAAFPGTSKHERGNALDLNEPARSWLRARDQYGFIKDKVRNEPWHFEHDGRILVRDAPKLKVETVQPVVLNSEDEMLKFMRTIDAAEGHGAVFMVREDGTVTHLNKDEWGYWTRLGASLAGGDWLRAEVDKVAYTLARGRR